MNAIRLDDIEISANLGDTLVFANRSNIKILFNRSLENVQLESGQMEENLLGLLHYENTLIHRFGSPNDEGLGNHPLYEYGLGFYSGYLVENSSWIEEMKFQSGKPESKFFKYHHFVCTFQESTFECIAQSYKVEYIIGERMEVAQKIIQSM